MRKQIMIPLIAAMPMILAQLSASTPSTMTTVEVEKSVKKEPADQLVIDGVVIARHDPRAVRDVKKYCMVIDKYILKGVLAKRSFIHTVDEANSVWSDWVEVKGGQIDLSEVEASVIVYERNGKVVFVECFARNRPKQTANVMRYYFRPDGSLAKSRSIIRNFDTKGLTGKVVAVRESYQAADGVGVGTIEKFYDARTGKKAKPVVYSGQIWVGIDFRLIHRLRDLPFFDLLQKPHRK